MTQYRYTTEVLRSPRMRWDGTRDGETPRNNPRIENDAETDQNEMVRPAGATAALPGASRGRCRLPRPGLRR